MGSNGIETVHDPAITREAYYAARGETPPDTNGNGTYRGLDDLGPDSGTSPSRHCEQCGTPLEGSRRYCSERCRAKARRAQARAAADVSTPADAELEPSDDTYQRGDHHRADRGSAVETSSTKFLTPLETSASVGDLVVELTRGLPTSGMTCATFEYDTGIAISVGRVAE